MSVMFSPITLKAFNKYQLIFIESHDDNVLGKCV